MANLIENPYKAQDIRLKRRPKIAKCLVLVFLNVSIVIFGGFLFNYLEGTPETVAKCGRPK